jgi:hypothetical protein
VSGRLFRRRARVDERFADTAGPMLKERGRVCPFKTVRRARVQDFASHYLLPPCSYPTSCASSHPQRHRLLCLQPARAFAAVMSNWTRSNVSREQLLYLVEAGQLRPLTAALEWRVPGDESVPRPQGVRGVVRGFP